MNQAVNTSSNPYILTNDWSGAIRTLAVIYLSVTSVLILVGNLTVITILCYRGDRIMTKAASILTVNLALADLLVGIFIIPFVIDLILHKEWRFPDELLELNAFANFFFCICSIVTLMLLSVEKYYHINHPLRYKRLLTPTRAVLLCFSAWIYSALCGLPPLVGVSSYFCFIPSLNQCTAKEWSGNMSAILFAILVVTFSYGLSMVIMITCYWRIFHTTYLHMKQIDLNRRIALRLKGLNNEEQKKSASQDSNIERQESESSSSRRTAGKNTNSYTKRLPRQLRAAKTLVIVIISYIVCWSPFCLVLFVEILLGRKVSGNLSLAFLWIGYGNSFCNPIIYALRFQSFRTSLKMMFRCPRRRVMPGNIDDTYRRQPVD